ncbi:hypothetical protein GQR58_003382 [Nymphon striatum]|nr:hypothetical protein GQR58_003382 [Nymphon striatum]
MNKHFEKIIEIKRGDDHRKFVEMIKAVDNESLNFSDVFEQYYNQDNYLSWFAVNILLGNYDTHFHNYYLLNPKDSEKFYFIPWDYDLSSDALLDPGEVTLDDLPRWGVSHANWWGQELHQRFMREPGNLDLLNEALIEVKNKYLTASKIQEKTDSYRDIVFPLVTSSPDFDRIYLSGDNDPEVIASYNRIYADLSNRVEVNYNRFLEHIGDPMPFDLFEPEFIGNDDIRFAWADSESITGATITYDLEISKTPKFQNSNIVDRVTDISDTSHVLHWTRPAGTYYYRIIARDAAQPQKYWQIGYNDLPDEIYGVIKFTAPEGGFNKPTTSRASYSTAN